MIKIFNWIFQTGTFSLVLIKFWHFYEYAHLDRVRLTHNCPTLLNNFQQENCLQFHDRSYEQNLPQLKYISISWISDPELGLNRERMRGSIFTIFGYNRRNLNFSGFRRLYSKIYGFFNLKLWIVVTLISRIFEYNLLGFNGFFRGFFREILTNL